MPVHILGEFPLHLCECFWVQIGTELLSQAGIDLYFDHGTLAVFYAETELLLHSSRPWVCAWLLLGAWGFYSESCSPGGPYSG